MGVLNWISSLCRQQPEEKSETQLEVEGARVLNDAIQSLSQVSQQIAADLVREKLSNENRIRFLKDTGLLDSSSDESIDRISYLASKMLKTPMSFVNLIDEKNVHIMGKYSLNPAYTEIRTVPFEESLCAYDVVLDKPLAIRDIRQDSFAQSAPVRSVADIGVISYLGVPLHVGYEIPLGSLCACDSVPRNWTEDDIHILTELSKLVVAIMVLKQNKPNTKT